MSDPDRDAPADTPVDSPDVDPDAWSGVHRGPAAGGRVGAAGRQQGPPAQHRAWTPGKRFFSNRGHFEHDDLIGREEGFTVTSSAGGEYLVFRPLLSEFVVSMPRGAAVVYPKDAAQIVAMADIFPGRPRGRGRRRLRRAHLLAAAGGRSARAGALLRAARGVRRRRPAQRAASSSAATTRPGDSTSATSPRRCPPPASAATGSSSTCSRRGSASTPPPRRCAPAASSCAYVATTTQLSRFVETVRLHGGFTEPQPWESLVRDWHVEGLAVRPGHKMIGHTAFLVTARRMAPGQRPPVKRRRPAPGAYGPDYTGPRPPGVPAEDQPGGLADPPRTGGSNRDQHRPVMPCRVTLTRVGSKAQEVASMSTIQQRGPEPRRAREPGALPGGRGLRPAPPAERRPRSLPRAGAAARRRAALARRGDLAERASRRHPARGPRPDHEAQGGGRPAGPAAGRLRHLPGPQRGRLDRRLHRRAASSGSTSARPSTSTSCSVARRSCSTRPSTSSPPSSSSRSARW